MYELGFFPQIFKTAKVVPIFKAGDKHLVRNYRPISLLSCLSKVLVVVVVVVGFFIFNHKTTPSLTQKTAWLKIRKQRQNVIR